MGLFKIIANNFWLKTIALVLAGITWLYVSQEMDIDYKSRTSAELLPDYGKMVTKKLFVKAIFVGEPSNNYKFNVNDVEVEPEYFMVAGFKDVIKDINDIQTDPIDVSRYRRTTVYEVGIQPIAPNIDTSKFRVRVTIPVEKIEEQPKQQPEILNFAEPKKIVPNASSEEVAK
ncbi:MAG: YbbR-like domain-containing protein [Candidatus Omnitrophica bacterium]|nr:YbbR-like domain-containing protein [Candidatus Omnitrophota bacterium]